jgi:RimJ/RimL family protein N-acetyltransferase
VAISARTRRPTRWDDVDRMPSGAPVACNRTLSSTRSSDAPLFDECRCMSAPKETETNCTVSLRREVLVRAWEMLRKLRDQRVWTAARRLIMNHVVVRFDRVLLFMSLDLGQPVRRQRQTWSFRIATLQNVICEQKYDDGWFARPEAIRRLQQGYRLFIIKQNDAISYFEWVETRRTRIRWMDLCFCMPPSYAYVTGVYTVPEFRRKGIAASVGAEILEYLRLTGVRRVVLVVDPANEASVSLHRRLGFREYQTVHYSRWGPIRYWRAEKPDSPRERRFVGLFSSPRGVWNAFL